jgi:hypothetical protein
MKKFVTMTKNGEFIEVDRSCVASHIKAHWKIAGSDQRIQLSKAEQDARQAATQNAVSQASAAVEAPLIKVEKDGVTLEINPTTLQSHLLAGWKVVDQELLASLAALKASRAI